MRPSALSIGERGRPTSSRRSGPSGAGGWFPSAAISSPARKRKRFRCRRRLNSSGGTNITLRPNAASSATPNTGTTLRNLFGKALRPSGTLMTPHSIAPRRHSTTRIMSQSQFMTTAGGSAWPRARRNMPKLKGGSLRLPSSRCLPSVLKATPTALRILRMTPPIARSSPANTTIGSSRAALATTCRRRPRKPSPKPSSTSPSFDRCGPSLANSHFRQGEIMSDMPSSNRGTILASSAAVGAASAPSSKARAGADGSAIRPFRINFPEEQVADLRQRVKATRWPDKETVADHSQGVQLATVRHLADYWASSHDWRKIEARLNALPQFVTEIDGLDIHFIHVRSKHENALPVIVTHGWPGSIIEQLKIIDPLTNPTAHGGSASDAFDVVIPSLP